MSSVNERPLRVLLVVDAFPGPDHVWDGVFLQDQAKAISAHATVGVVRARTCSPRQLLAARGRMPTEDTRLQEGAHVYERTAFVVTARLTERLIGARMRAVERAIRDFEREFGPPDLIHGHCAAFAGETALRVGRARGVPVVITEHYSFLPELIATYGERLLAVYDQADLVCAVSNSLIQRMHDLGVRRPISCVHDAVDTQTFDFSPLEPPADGVWRILAVARDHDVKDVPTLIRALAELPGDLRTETAIVGPGDYAEPRQLCHQLGCAERVHFVGEHARPVLARFMRQAHLIVSSSRIETFGLSIAEGLAIGRPVVVTDSGGPRDIVRPQDGTIVPVGDARALTDAIADVLGRYGEFGQAALSASARARFGLAAFADRMLEAYHGVLRLRSTRCAGQPSERLRPKTPIARLSDGRTDRARPRSRCRQPAGEGG